MDDEEEIPVPAQQMPPFMRVAALTMTGDFILVFGLIFILLGAAAFITDFLKIKGIGEMLVGLALCAIAVALLFFSSRQMPKVQMVARPPPERPAMKTKPDDSGSYR